MRYRTRITEMEEDIRSIMLEEQEERQIRAVENQANKAQRLLENGTSGEKRDWFQSHRQRMEEKGKSGQVYRVCGKLIFYTKTGAVSVTFIVTKCICTLCYCTLDVTLSVSVTKFFFFCM